MSDWSSDVCSSDLSNRASQSDTLTLAPGKLRGIAIGDLPELHQFQPFPSTLPDLHPVGPGSPIPHGKPEGHIFSHGHVLEKRIMLKNEADVPIGDLEIRHVFAIEDHLAGIRNIKERTRTRLNYSQ